MIFLSKKGGVFMVEEKQENDGVLTYTTRTVNIPEEYKPISMWGYLGYQLLFSIPLIGFILLVVFSLGGTKNINLKNDNNKNDKDSDIIYLNGKKLEDIYSITTKNTNAQTISASNNDYNKLASMINKNEENRDNKIIVSNSLCTPKKLENNKKVKVNKKVDNSFPNNQKLYLCDKTKASKNINLKKKNNNATNYSDLINYSLSFKGFSNKSNYSSTHNTRRNSNFEEKTHIALLLKKRGEL